MRLLLLAPLEREFVRPKEERGVEEIAEERALEEGDAGYGQSAMDASNGG